MLIPHLTHGLLGVGFQFVHVVRGVVGQRMTLQVAPAVFVGVQLRRVRRQKFRVESWMPSEIGLNLFAPMSIQAIPDQDHPAALVPKQVAQKSDHLLLADRVVRMEMEIPPHTTTARRNGQRADQRQVTVVPRAGLQDGRLTARSPSAMHERTHENAGFVDEHKRAAAAGGLFFSRGQVRLIQVWIPASSRSRARRSGFCTEKPKDFISLGM